MNWQTLKDKIESELYTEILPFWMENMKDPSGGGLWGHLSNELIIDPLAPKGLVMISRFLWTYAEAFRISGREEYLDFAEYIRNYLLTRFWDDEFEGFFWTVDSTGNPLESKKVLYGQAFALYGLSTYGQIKPDNHNKLICRKIFNLLESHGRDTRYGGYFEACNRDWSPGGQNTLGADDQPCDKSMNTNLHILEAYTRYFWQSGDNSVGTSLSELIEVITAKIYNPETGHQNLYFSADWTPSGSIESYGHDVETSWLIWEALEILDQKPLLRKYRSIVLKMLDISSSKAAAPDGSLFNESENGHMDKTRIWWVQAEYAVSLMNGWMMTGREDYKKKLFHLWDYIEKKQKDTVHGEWFWGIEDDGKVQNREKGGMWKTPYHNGRACLELIHRIDTILKDNRAEQEYLNV